MLKTTSCQFVVCDDCGAECEDGDGVVCHFPNGGEAEEKAQNADWFVWNGHHFCEECYPSCSTCGDAFGDHDYGEGHCEDCNACQRFTLAKEQENRDARS